MSVSGSLPKTLLLNDSFDQQSTLFRYRPRYYRPGRPAIVCYTAGGRRRPIGMTRFYAIAPTDKALEIGYTWYTPAVWGRVHNKESQTVAAAVCV